MIRSAVLVVALMSSCSVAAADHDAPMNILGLELGQPLSLEECPIKWIGSYQMYDGAGVYELSSPCFRKGFSPDSSMPDLQNGQIQISLGKAPPGFKSGEGYATVIDGNLEGVWLFTYGLNAQDQVLEALTAKYGKPTNLTTEKWQNRMGATFDGVEAMWNFQNLEVSFSGLGSELDTGFVTVKTPRAVEKANADAAAAKATAPKL